MTETGSRDNVNKWIEKFVRHAWEPLRESIAQGLEAMAAEVHSPEQSDMFAARVLGEAAGRVRDGVWDPALKSVVEMRRDNKEKGAR